MLINDRPVQARKNLHDAMRQISEHYSRYLRQRGTFKCPHPRGATLADESALLDRRVSGTSFPGGRRLGPVVDHWRGILGGRKYVLRECDDKSEKDCSEEVSCTLTNLEENCFWAKHDPPRLWIDAICINQNDIPKNFQVRMMGPIFSSAKLVFAWISLSEAGSDDALQILSMSQRQLCHFVEKGKLNDSLVAAIVSLCERTYWRRVWIQQEIVLTKKCVVMCGPGSVISRSLDEALDELIRLSYAGHQNINKKSISRSAAYQAMYSKGLASLNFCPLDRWLVACVIANLQATVPHDYLYALIPVSSHYPTLIDKTKIEVDYNKSVAEFYRQLLHAFVEDPTASRNRKWLLQLSRRMGLSDEEAEALLKSGEITSRKYDATDPRMNSTEHALLFRYLEFD